MSWSQMIAWLDGVKFEAALTTFLVLELIALLSAPSVLLRRRGRPTAAVAWLFALFAIPGGGVFFWWLFGRTRIERKRRKRVQKKRSFQQKRGAPETTPGTAFEAMLPERARRDSVFASPGNVVELYTTGERAFAALEEAIEGARHCIHLLYYIYHDDETGRRIAERLMRKAAEGVRVRVLLDGFGSQAETRRLRRDLAAAGVQVAVFLPSQLNPLHAPRINFTNHRKITTIDDAVAFTGGMNIGAEYEHVWRDLMVRIEGPAVEALNHVFLEDWYFATNEAVFSAERNTQELIHRDGVDMAVVASGPDSEPWIHDAYFLAITRANQRIWIVTPYFIPTSAIIVALRTAAGRGVDVRIVVPSESDVAVVKWASRSFYRSLTSAGVRIYEYDGPMLHAKALIADDLMSSVGTANIDSRGLGLSFEVSCFWSCPRLTRELSSWFEELLLEANHVTLASIDKKPLRQKLLESAAHLFSPVL